MTACVSRLGQSEISGLGKLLDVTLALNCFQIKIKPDYTLLSDRKKGIYQLESLTLPDVTARDPLRA